MWRRENFAIVSDMVEPVRRTYRNFRRRIDEPKPVFPEDMPYPSDAPISIKHIGFLYEHCKIPAFDITARYPESLTHSLVFLGLSHYYKHKAAYDAEIIKEAEFNRNDSLSNLEMKVPSVGLATLVKAEEAFEAVREAEPRREAELKKKWK